MRALVLVLATTACAEPVVEMSLSYPAQMPAGFDLSCVTAVDVAGHRADEELPMDIGQRAVLGSDSPCVEIAPQTTFEGLHAQIAGRFELDLDGLAAIQIRGRVGTCNDAPNYHESIFYGGTAFEGDDVTLALTPNISCGARQTYKVRPIDVPAMLADATHTCRPVTDGLATFPGNIRPSEMTPAMAPLVFEAGTGASLLDAAGTASVQAFAAALSPETCIALAHAGQLVEGMTCVNKGAPTLCGGAGEIEVPIYPFVYSSAAINGAAFASAGALVLGSVWETNPNQPVANAVVTTQAAGVKIDYLQLVNGQPQVIPGATKTGPSGLFIVYTPKVVQIAISAPGHQMRTLTVGGAWDLDGTALAVLPKL